MSGDVQPRKRKDKKRKKDDSAEQIPSQPQTPSSTNQNEDLNIHVHKEDGTGGGICAKIIFFLLFSALAILIGLIITEHRGLTDLDTVDQESRFSQLFEGWIDNSLNHDDEGDHTVNSLEYDNHEEDETESPETDDDEDDEEGDEEEEQDEEQEDELSEEVSAAKDEENEDETEEQDEEEQDEDEDEDDDDDDVEDDVQALESEEQDDNTNESELKDDEDDDDDNEAISEENNHVEEDISKNIEISAEDGKQDEVEGADDDDNDEHADDDSGSKGDEFEEENPTDPSQENESEEVTEETPIKDEEEEEEAEYNGRIEEKQEDEKADADEDQKNSKMVVKIGVGVALLVVAHVVLVRKWKSAETPEKEEPIPDLSRRNTIVVPPTYQEIQRDIDDNVEEDYSDEDGEVESDEDRIEGKSTKLKYQELRTTYTRSLTPESEPEYQNKPADADEEEYEEDEEDEEEDEEEEESDAGEYEKEDDDDDDELLKRLEAKYGKLGEGNQEEEKNDDFDEQFSSWKRVNVRPDNEPEESDSDKQSDDMESYEYENITNKADFNIKEKIDEAQKNVKNNTAYAIKLFDALLQNYSFSPRSLYGKAQALDMLAEQKRSNDILQKAIAFYLKVLDLKDVPDILFKAAAERCINRMRFMGNYNRAVEVHKKLISQFPEDVKHRNQLVVTYLTINRVNKARMILQETLSKYPNDGFALVHYGFILKTADNNLDESVSYLQRGIATKEPGVIDGRFYFHLGDALARIGKNDEAMKVYEEGVQYKLFLSKYQRSLYNVERLKGKPWWKKEETPYTNLYTTLESNWKKIRDEGLSVLSENGLFQNESENLKDTGNWKQFELFARGQKNIRNCKKCPVTCKIIESIPDAKGCRRGQTKFSVIHPGTHVWPHCGPTNCRLRVHLGLNVPVNTFIRVANEIRSWENGKIFIFDDSFEHEVWHNGTTFRLVLIIDVWHPELTSAEKRTLSPI